MINALSDLLSVSSDYHKAQDESLQYDRGEDDYEFITPRFDKINDMGVDP